MRFGMMRVAWWSIAALGICRGIALTSILVWRSGSALVLQQSFIFFIGWRGAYLYMILERYNFHISLLCLQSSGSMLNIDLSTISLFNVITDCLIGKLSLMNRTSIHIKLLFEQLYEEGQRRGLSRWEHEHHIYPGTNRPYHWGYCER